MHVHQPFKEQTIEKILKYLVLRLLPNFYKLFEYSSKVSRFILNALFRLKVFSFPFSVSFSANFSLRSLFSFKNQFGKPSFTPVTTSSIEMPLPFFFRFTNNIFFGFFSFRNRSFGFFFSNFYLLTLVSLLFPF